MRAKNKQAKVKEDLAHYYDRRGILMELEEAPVEFSLEEELRKQIISRKEKAIW